MVRRSGKILLHRVSVSNAKGPPVPIPNTEVKLCSGDNTCLETSRDDSSMLTQKALKVNTFKAFFKIFIMGYSQVGEGTRL